MQTSVECKTSVECTSVSLLCVMYACHSISSCYLRCVVDPSDINYTAVGPQ